MTPWTTALSNLSNLPAAEEQKPTERKTARCTVCGERPIEEFYIIPARQMPRNLCKVHWKEYYAKWKRHKRRSDTL